ncbi:MAG: Bax inhibitor-1/YccA family protein [Fusobacterium sp.]|nr:Bax inhibitor-1/YccA family protein [Fusobacterium sp.]
MYYNEVDVDLRQMNNFLRKVFLNMVIGILLTIGVVLGIFFYAPQMLNVIVNNFTILAFAQIGTVLGLSFGINKISSGTARIIFFAYSMLTGLTMTGVGLMYDPLSILYALGITLTIFIVMSVFGYTTQEDLSQYRRFLMIGLISLIIMAVINIFIGVGPLYWIQTILGVVIFTGLIAFDVNRIKKMAYQFANDDGENTEAIEKYGIIGALQLYLDFINLFLYILRIFGKKR